MLTEREAAVLTALIEYIETNQYPPSVREVISITDVTSTSMINYYYDSLIKKGYIEKVNNRSRAIRIKPKAHTWYNSQLPQEALF